MPTFVSFIASRSSPCPWPRPPNGAHDRLVGDGGQVRAGVSVGALGDLVQVHILGQWLALEVHLEYGLPASPGPGRSLVSGGRSAPGAAAPGRCMSGRFVARDHHHIVQAISRPSISVSSWEMTLSVTCESESPPRIGAMESISSMKMMQGAACLALRNVSRTAFSLSPTHLLRNSGPLTLMKFALRFRSHRLRQHGLAGAWRTVQQHTLGRVAPPCGRTAWRTSAATPPPPSAPPSRPPVRRSRPNAGWGTR